MRGFRWTHSFSIRSKNQDLYIGVDGFAKCRKKSFLHSQLRAASRAFRQLEVPRAIVFATACLINSYAQALPQRMDAEQIVRDPKPFVGREIRLASTKCAREPEGKYACTAGHGDSKLRIESLAIDFQTSEQIRRLIVLRCSTRLEKVDSACIFDIELKIVGIRIPPAGDTSSNVVVTARKMNLFTTKSQ